MDGNFNIGDVGCLSNATILQFSSWYIISVVDSTCL